MEIAKLGQEIRPFRQLKSLKDLNPPDYPSVLGYSRDFRLENIGTARCELIKYQGEEDNNPTVINPTIRRLIPIVSFSYP